MRQRDDSYDRDLMIKMLTDGSAQMGLPLEREDAERLAAYYEILTERNKSVNLTRITTPEEAVTKHFLDSLTARLTGKVRGKVIDVGTGAGLPGLVLKCSAPELDMTLLDARNKRVNFLREVAAVMGITEGVHFIHARAEDAGRLPEHHEGYDTVVSRAVANMRTLGEWCMPLVRPGGYLLALKGPAASDELREALPAIRALGGEPERIFECAIPFAELEHKIIIIKKVKG